MTKPIPTSHGLERRMLQVALQIAPDARAQPRITRLAVALPQPREDADDLGVPLRAEHVIGHVESVARACDPLVAVEHRGLELGRHVAPRVLQQRDEVIGWMPRQRVLEIEQAQTLAALDQHDVLGMVIAQHRDGRVTREQRREYRIPRIDIALHVDFETHRGGVPFGQQSRLALIFGKVISADVRRLVLAQPDQQIDCFLVEPQLALRCGVHRLAQPRISEILEQDETVYEILREDRRRREAASGQPARDRYERARVLVRRRRVHQDRTAVVMDDAEIAPERSVAGERPDLGPLPSGGNQEVGRRGGRIHVRSHRSLHAAGTFAVKARAPSGVSSRLSHSASCQ